MIDSHRGHHAQWSWLVGGCADGTVEWASLREEASASRLRSDNEVVLISVVADDELDIQDLVV